MRATNVLSEVASLILTLPLALTTTTTTTGSSRRQQQQQHQHQQQQQAAAAGSSSGSRQQKQQQASAAPQQAAAAPQQAAAAAAATASVCHVADTLAIATSAEVVVIETWSEQSPKPSFTPAAVPADPHAIALTTSKM